MTEAIGLGMTHYPMLLTTDNLMARLLAGTLTDPDIPADEKDTASWPESMRSDWSDDNGAAAAAHHRLELVDGLGRVRSALDDFDLRHRRRVGRRPVRELPRRGRPTVLRAGLRRPRGTGLRDDRRARQPQRVGPTRRHQDHTAWRRRGRARTDQRADRGRLRHGLLVQEARRRALPACDPQHPAVSGLRELRRETALSPAHHGELLRTTCDRP